MNSRSASITLRADEWPRASDDHERTLPGADSVVANFSESLGFADDEVTIAREAERVHLGILTAPAPKIKPR